MVRDADIQEKRIRALCCFHVEVLSMHKDGEARTKRDVESSEIKGCTKTEEQMEKKLFIYRTAGLGPGVRTVITHYQQRGRAEITGRCCDAHPGVQMKLHKTKQCTSRREECGELE